MCPLNQFFFWGDRSDLQTKPEPASVGIMFELSSLFGRKDNHAYGSIESGPTSLPRKVPVKVEPKVYFANERTFLAWLHMSVTLAGIRYVCNLLNLFSFCLDDAISY